MVDLRYRWVTLRRYLVPISLFLLLFLVLVWDMRRVKQLSDIIHDDHQGIWEKISSSTLSKWFNDAETCLLTQELHKSNLQNVQKCARPNSRHISPNLRFKCNLGSSIGNRQCLPPYKFKKYYSYVLSLPGMNDPTNQALKRFIRYLITVNKPLVFIGDVISKQNIDALFCEVLRTMEGSYIQIMSNMNTTQLHYTIKWRNKSYIIHVYFLHMTHVQVRNDHSYEYDPDYDSKDKHYIIENTDAYDSIQRKIEHKSNRTLLNRTLSNRTTYNRRMQSTKTATTTTKATKMSSNTKKENNFKLNNNKNSHNKTIGSNNYNSNANSNNIGSSSSSSSSSNSGNSGVMGKPHTLHRKHDFYNKSTAMNNLHININGTYINNMSTHISSMYNFAKLTSSMTLEDVKSQISVINNTFHGMISIVNIGVWYNTRERFRYEIAHLLHYLNQLGETNDIFYRETAAQHWNFTSYGYFTNGGDPSLGGCVPLQDANPDHDWRNRDVYNTIINNEYHNIHMIPFRDITAALYNMHPNDRQTRDCTRYCYFPQLWQIIWYHLDSMTQKYSRFKPLVVTNSTYI